MIKMRRLILSNVGADVEQLELSHIANENEKWYSHVEK